MPALSETKKQLSCAYIFLPASRIRGLKSILQPVLRTVNQRKFLARHPSELPTSPRILIWSRRDDYRSKAVMPLESMEIPPRPPSSFLFRLPIPTRLGFILREPDSVSWFPEDVVLRWVRIISSLWPVSWPPVFWRPLLL
jgi:hypothetical protein